MIAMDMELDAYYDAVERQADLRTAGHARRWSTAVLRTLGFSLRRSPKNELADVLPDELSSDLKRGWKLISFFNPRLTLEEFLKQVALRSGNTDEQYAERVTSAVFNILKSMISPDLSDDIARSLPDEVGEFWRKA